MDEGSGSMSDWEADDSPEFGDEPKSNNGKQSRNVTDNPEEPNNSEQTLGTIATSEKSDSLKPYQSNHANGNLKVSGFLLAGERTGTWSHYHPDGTTLLSVGEMANNHRVGIWKLFYADGRLHRRVVYDNAGNQLTKEEWDEKGEPVKNNSITGAAE
jgi:antitoxin component YwqK of YwqJK toxin-antitoxin module